MPLTLGAQTERRGKAGPVSALLGREGSPADSLSLSMLRN
jgi:hypothetical protein